MSRRRLTALLLVCACADGTLDAPVHGLGDRPGTSADDDGAPPMETASPWPPHDDELEGSTTTPEIPTSTGSDTDALVPGPDETIELFDGVHLYWVSGDDARRAETTVTLPDAAFAYERIVLDFGVGCPGVGGCDHWARIGWVSLVRGVDDSEEEIELARFVTPYRLPASWELDVTELRPLLQGEVRLRVFVSTWVGPGSDYGDGWLFDAALRFEGGIPAEVPAFAVPLWPRTQVQIGDPNVPVKDFVSPVDVPAMEGASRIGFRALVTGHGQGNADNCGEFCPLVHTISVDDLPYEREIWRDDCDRTPLGDQPGTWQHPRAGWCPGASVVPWMVHTDAPAESPLSIVYGLENYVNSCRPDVATCSGCALGNDCAYDGGLHTPPYVLLSAILIGYR